MQEYLPARLRFSAPDPELRTVVVTEKSFGTCSRRRECKSYATDECISTITRISISLLFESHDRSATEAQWNWDTENIFSCEIIRMFKNVTLVSKSKLFVIQPYGQWSITHEIIAEKNKNAHLRN